MRVLRRREEEARRERVNLEVSLAVDRQEAAKIDGLGFLRSTSCAVRPTSRAVRPTTRPGGSRAAAAAF